jgi:ABC-2 type transport system ATP-binding protein
MSAIEVRGLTKRFGPVLAVDQLSFEVERGTVTGFLGSNGAGKTTTLRMLLGLVRPDAGTATINGQPYRDLDEPLHQVGAVLEASGYYPGRTARNHLRIQAMAGQADPSRIDDVLEFAGLAGAADRRIGGFSLGMRQRLGLATALLTDPEVLILDEPANGCSMFQSGTGASAGTPLPFAAAAALLAGLAILFCTVAARTTVARDVS